MVRLTIGHRPRLKAIPAMAEKYDLVVVLLKDNERAHELLNQYHKCGVNTLHVPFRVGQMLPPMTWDEADHIRHAIKTTAIALCYDACVFIHCSAGIHRTGTFTYAVLRRLGETEDEAIAHIHALRPVTAIGMMPFVEWAEDTLVGDDV